MPSKWEPEPLAELAVFISAGVLVACLLYFAFH